MCLVLRLFILSVIKFEADEEISILLAVLAAVFSAIDMKLMNSPNPTLNPEFINTSFFLWKKSFGKVGGNTSMLNRMNAPASTI